MIDRATDDLSDDLHIYARGLLNKDVALSSLKLQNTISEDRVNILRFHDKSTSAWVSKKLLNFFSSELMIVQVLKKLII